MYHISISSKCFLKNTQENFFNKRRRRWALLEPNCYLKCDSRFEFGAISSPSRARNNKIKCNSTHKIGEWRVSGCGGGEALSSIRLEKFVFWVRALLSRFQAWHASSMVQHERQQSKEKVLSKVPSKMFFFVLLRLIWCLFTLVMCVVGKLKFHSRNQDIIKVLVSWQRNEIFFFIPKIKKKTESETKK